jgi:superfamily II DNA/RNA helicase
MKSRRIRWAGRMARMGEKGNAYRLLVVENQRERPLGRLKR